MLVAGGLGVKPYLGELVTDFIDANNIYTFTTAVLRVFDRYGERQKRNKARLKYLVEEIGLEQFLKLVEQEHKVIDDYRPDLINENTPTLNEVEVAPIVQPTDEKYANWLKTNVYKQKQESFFAIQLKITNGNISSSTARKLAQLVTDYSNGELRITINQGLIIKFVKEASLPYFFQELTKLHLANIGFDSVADITACPNRYL